jgi:hypothetical protein
MMHQQQQQITRAAVSFSIKNSGRRSSQEVAVHLGGGGCRMNMHNMHNMHTASCTRSRSTNQHYSTTSTSRMPLTVLAMAFPPTVPFQSFSTSTSTATSTACPFRTLSIPKTSPYSHAKKAFLQVAMKNHPDTIHQHLSKDDPQYDSKMERSITTFKNARMAFEALVKNEEDGTCLLRIQVEAKEELMKQQQQMNDDQFE